MLLASCSEYRTIRIWDVRTRTTVGEPLEGHSDYVTSVAFSPDGMLLGSGSHDRTLRIWDIYAQPSQTNHFSKSAGPPRSTLSSDLSPPLLHGSLITFHPSLCSLQELKDGWVVGPNGELVLWIPPTLRWSLGANDNRMLAVLGNPNFHNTLLDFDDMAYGSDWAQCRTIDS